jgi:hypothetical protein
MSVCRICGLSIIGLVALMEPAFAFEAVPGPIAGIGLPTLAIIGGAYWIGRKVSARKNEK